MHFYRRSFANAKPRLVGGGIHTIRFRNWWSTLMRSTRAFVVGMSHIAFARKNQINPITRMSTVSFGDPPDVFPANHFKQRYKICMVFMKRANCGFNVGK